MDLRKKFDSVNRNMLWRILVLRGLPPKLVNLTSGRYSDTKYCDNVQSVTTSQLLGYVRDVFYPQPTSTLAKTMYWAGCRKNVLGRMSVFAATTHVLSEALESLREEPEPLGLRVCWIKANGHIIHATTESIPLSGENVEVTQASTYIGSVIHSSIGCEVEGNL